MLTGLTISGSTLTPSFSPFAFNYNGSETQSKCVLVSPQKYDSGASMLINGSSAYGDTYVALKSGTNTITIKLTSGDNSATYKVNLPVKNPVSLIATQPQNQTVASGQTATFNVAPVVPITVVRYQWQELSWRATYPRWNDCPHGTNMYLQITGNTYNNGFKYRCILFDGDGNAEMSNEATLTVT